MNNFSISSSGLPLVSGTFLEIQTKAKMLIIVKRAKAPDVPTILTMLRNEALTTNAAPQLAAVATAIARPRTRVGKISEIMVHTTGPSENANEAM